MSPRMRPSSTRKLMPSSAMVFPNDLRRPRASMQAIASALLFFCGIQAGGIRVGTFLRAVLGYDIERRWTICAVQKFFRVEAEPLNGRMDSGPIFRKKLLPFTLQQQFARAGIDEHAQAAPGFDQAVIHQLLISLEDRKWIDAIFCRDSAH